MMMGTESAFTTAGIFPFRLSLLLVFLYLLFLWFLLVKFVYEDAHLRSKNAFFIRLSLFFVIFFNFPGLLLYLILRPVSTFKEAERAELEDELVRIEIEKLRKAKK